MALAALRFAGEVRCEQREGQAPGVVLLGTEAPGGEGAAIEVAFVVSRLPGLAARLQDAVVEELAPHRFLIRDAQHRFELEARSVHVHRDARRPFFAAVPPRPAPLGRRIFFRVVPVLVASPLGRRLLRALRGR